MMKFKRRPRTISTENWRGMPSLHKIVARGTWLGRARSRRSGYTYVFSYDGVIYEVRVPTPPEGVVTPSRDWIMNNAMDYRRSEPMDQRPAKKRRLFGRASRRSPSRKSNPDVIWRVDLSGHDDRAYEAILTYVNADLNVGGYYRPFKGYTLSVIPYVDEKNYGDYRVRAYTPMEGRNTIILDLTQTASRRSKSSDARALAYAKQFIQNY